jgi:hypothetical protein
MYGLMYLSVNAWDYTGAFNSPTGSFTRLITLPLLIIVIPFWQIFKDGIYTSFMILISIAPLSFFLFWLQGKVNE